MSNFALDVRNVSFSYGKKAALNNVNIQIEQGQTCVLLGPNGAGKTTLFSLISGLFSTREGDIAIAGKSLRTNGASALAPLGIVFQAQTLDLDLSVQQNLAYFCSLHGMNRHNAGNRIADALSRLELLDKRHEKVRTLNGGHRRRVEIARATLHQPTILLLDEPTVGLDIPTRRTLIDYLHNLPSQDGTAIFWATHLVDEVAANDRVVVMSQGRVTGDATAENLASQTGTDSLEAAFQVLTE